MLGSKYWISHPTVDLGSVRFMLNLDMVGRLDPKNGKLTFTAIGMGHRDIADAISIAPDGLHVEADRGKSIFASASDHAPYFEKGMPTCFLFTGIHPDYHRPSDTVDKMNWDGLAIITRYAQALATEYSTVNELPKFKLRGDFGAVMVNGKIAKVWRAAQGGAAEAAGIMQGDEITQIGSHPVNDPKGLEKALDSYDQGDAIKVKLVRGGKEMETEVVLK